MINIKTILFLSFISITVTISFVFTARYYKIDKSQFKNIHSPFWLSVFLMILLVNGFAVVLASALNVNLGEILV